MKITYKFTMPNGDIRYVAGKGRQSACMRLTGMRVRAAIESRQILSVEIRHLAKDDQWTRSKPTQRGS